MTINIVGFPATAKVPGFYGQTVYGAGAITAADIPLKLLLMGNMTSAGTSTPDSSIDAVLSATDADTYYGPGSELAIMCYGALQIPGVKLYAAPVAEGTNAVGATATITITGTWTAVGTFTYRICGIPVTGGIAATDTISIVADSIVAAINQNTHLPCTAAKGAATAYVVTLTMKSKGPRGNQGLLFQDTSLLPSGMTSTIAGGSSATGGLKFFGATPGSVVDSVANVLALISTTQYDRIAAAEGDAVNAALIKAALNTQAGPTIGILGHCVMANNASLSASTSIAQTSINAERIEYLWYLNGETIPSFVAATFAAYRTAVEQTDPDAAYDGYVLPGVVPQCRRPDGHQ